VAYLLLNAGVVTTALALVAGSTGPAALAGRGAEGLAALAFGLHAWPRVKPFG
jgi:hypothetical protein